MVEFFSKSEYESARRSRNKILAIYLVVLFIYLAFSVGVYLWYLTLPYMSPTISTVKWVHHPVSVVFVIFSFIYLGIPYKRTKKYYVMTTYMLTGLKETSNGSFFEYDESIRQKDGVDYKALVFLEWNKFKEDFFERRVLVPAEKEFPKFSEKDEVRFITQGNVLYSYEILSKGEEYEDNNNGNRE